MAYHGILNIVKRLVIDKSMDLKCKNNQGNTALMYACQQGHLDTVKFILEQEGIDVNESNQRENTPLLLAAKNGHEDVVMLLIEKGANVNQINKEHSTPVI
ncbi:hypothetical protein PIROE2DRAFT_45886, partial [Piromyces sp. E2]